MMQPAEVIGQTYKSEEGKFKIKFPGAIDITEKEKEKYKTTQITCTVNENVYFVVCTTHSAPMKKPKELAKVSLDSFVESLSGKISTKSDWDIKGNSGYIAVINIDKTSVIHYRVVIVGQIQYQVVVIGKKTNYEEEVAKKFFKSFKICK